MNRFDVDEFFWSPRCASNSSDVRFIFGRICCTRTHTHAGDFAFANQTISLFAHFLRSHISSRRIHNQSWLVPSKPHASQPVARPRAGSSPPRPRASRLPRQAACVTPEQTHYVGCAFVSAVHSVISALVVFFWSRLRSPTATAREPSPCARSASTRSRPTF